MEVALLTMYANANTKIGTIVIPDNTHANSVKPAVDGSVVPLGVASEASRVRPDPDISSASATALDYAANAGESLRVYGPGATGVPLYCNVAWSPGDLIMADASGYGIACTSGSYYAGRAEGTGTVGAYCPITVMPGLMH